MFEIVLYQLENGKIPVEEFIRGLDPKMQAKAIASIHLLSEYGNSIREPYSKAMGEGLFELRIKFSSDISRIFYFFLCWKRNCSHQRLYQEKCENAYCGTGACKKV